MHAGSIFYRRSVGIGLLSQLFPGDFFIISMITLVDMMQNDSMSLSVTVSLAYGFVSWSSPASMLTRIVLILSTKNSLNSFANCSFDVLGGNGKSFFLPNRSLQMS